MRFAEVTQEVVVDRPQTVKQDLGLAPGRRRANLLYKAALQEVVAMQESGGSSDETEEHAGYAFNPNAPHPYQLALGVLCVQKYLSDMCGPCSLAELKAFLENRQRIRTQLIEDLRKKQVAFRVQLLAQEQELGELRSVVSSLKAQKVSREKSGREMQRLKTIISSQDEQIAQLHAELERAHGNYTSSRRELERTQQQLSQVAQQKDVLMRTTEMYEADKRELEHELDAERKVCQKKREEKEVLRRQMQGFVSHEKEKFERLAHEMKEKEKKLRQVKELIRNSPCTTRTPLKDSTQQNTHTSPPEVVKESQLLVRSRGGRKRSLSENWLEHKPSTTVDNGDLLQPQLKKKRTVAAPRARDLRSRQVDKYCLQHQEEDSEGDVKTELYKGEIMHTRGGGTSVQFTDVEVLKHSKPISPRRLRSSTRLRQARSHSHNDTCTSTETSMEDEWTDVETRCAVAIEGHPGSSPALTHTRASRPTKK